MLRISLVFLGSTGAGPVYSYEMANALCNSNRCYLQIIISSNISNLDKWKSTFLNRKDVDFHVIDAYKRSPLHVVYSSLFDKQKKQFVINLITSFQSNVLYIPFGLLWADYIFKCLKNQLRIITTIHDPHPHDSFWGNIKWGLFRLITSENCMHNVHDIILLNKKDINYVYSKYHKNIIVIPHASFSYYVRKFQVDYKIRNTIGFFGRIEPYKGLDLLVDAFEKQGNDKLKLIIAGSGKVKKSLRDRIQKNDRIKFINRYIADDEFQCIMDKIDFVVLPYKRASQSGVIPMAFAFGKTVIATNVGSLADQIPKDTGLIVESNVQDIVNAINKLYHEPNLIYSYGSNAREYSKSELTWEYSALLLLDYLGT